MSLRTPVRFSNDTCILRLQGDIQTESIFQLCDDIDLAIDYYQYNQVLIEIDSNGGSVASLEYYVSKWYSWKAQDVRISTRALTNATSAAAYIFAMGDVGARYAYPSSRLAFHYGQSGFSEKSSVMLDELERRASRLKELDQRFLELVVDQVWHSVNVLGATAYPILPEGADEVKLESMWDSIGVRGKQIGDPKKTPKKVYDQIRATIEAVHEYGEAIEPLAAKSLLLVDHIDSFEHTGD